MLTYVRYAYHCKGNLLKPAVLGPTLNSSSNTYGMINQSAPLEPLSGLCQAVPAAAASERWAHTKAAPFSGAFMLSNNGSQTTERKASAQ